MADVITLSDSDSEVQDEEEDPNLPSREECEARCQTFAEVTGTDTALAMFYLQDREWIVERAINDFFAESGGASSASPKAQSGTPAVTTSPSASATTNTSIEKKTNTEKAKGTLKTDKGYLTTAPPLLQPKNENRVRVLSWNIDGLDPDNLQSRTMGACSVLMQEMPEVIFLQEVVGRSLQIIQTQCEEHYQVFPGIENPNTVTGEYFTAMLLRKDCVSVESVNLADFPTTMMSRNLLEVQCKVKEIPVALITSHLESTAEYSAERIKQLRIAFSRVTDISKDRTVIFGGDLNLREKELTGLSAKPNGVYDMWECTGKRPEAKFTWDLTINDNKQLGLKFQPKCRFDRLYIRHSKEVKLKPVYFELVGIQRLQACHRFPSDHWGILAHMDIK